MKMAEWISELEPDEQAYARQCFRFWNGTNGNQEPTIPNGMSRSRADILRYHVKSLNNGQIGRRKVEENPTLSFRVVESLKRDLAYEAAQLDLSLSEYLLRCINAGRPLVMAYREVSKFFDKPQISH